MTETDRRSGYHRTALLVADMILAVAVGLMVVILLAPTSITDAEPPVCRAPFGFAVPCTWAFTYGASLIALVVTAIVLVLLRRRRH